MKITYQDKDFEITKPMKVNQILQEECTKEIIAFKCNNQIRPLYYIIKED